MTYVVPLEINYCYVGKFTHLTYDNITSTINCGATLNNRPYFVVVQPSNRRLHLVGNMSV